MIIFWRRKKNVEGEIIMIIAYAKYVVIKAKKSCDNHDNHIQQEAMIVFREKLKTPFRINPILSVHMMVRFGLSAFLIIGLASRDSCETHETKLVDRFASCESLRQKFCCENREKQVSLQNFVARITSYESHKNKFHSKTCFSQVSQINFVARLANYDFACLQVSQIAQYTAFSPSPETCETRENCTDIFARSESHFPQNFREKNCEARLAVNPTHNTGLLLLKTTLASIFTRIKRKIVTFFIFTSSFLRFRFRVFETHFFRNLGSSAKLWNSRNSSLIFAKHENRFVSNFTKFSRNVILSKTLLGSPSPPPPDKSETSFCYGPIRFDIDLTDIFSSFPFIFRPYSFSCYLRDISHAEVYFSSMCIYNRVQVKASTYPCQKTWRTHLWPPGPRECRECTENITKN